ncbi:MAG: STAS domain-containing protein [Candidatus Hydrogenedentes bacterium]|nr:STAS domain-containing protein [Candidatus Hydrogenedentota bacterium]
MTIKRKEVGNVTVLRMEGNLDESGVDTLRDALLICLDSGRCNIVMNLGGVGQISFMGLGVIVERLRKIRARGGDIKLVGVNLHAERLFRMAGITSLFETYASEPLALRAYQEAA